MKVLNLDPDIIQIPEDRFRLVLQDESFKRLMNSIMELGQLQPIGVTVDEDGTFVLVYGHRRLLALREIKRKLGDDIKVAAVVLGKEVTKLNRKILEFVENSARKDFTPAEKALAIAEIHETLSRENPGWTVAKTAEALAISRGYVQENLKIAKALKAGDIPEDEAKKLTVKELSKLTSTVGKVQRLSQSLMAKEVIRASASAEHRYRIIEGDAFKILPELGETYDICITDPPYGLDYKEQTKTADRGTDFEDDPVEFLNPEFISKFWSLLDSIMDKERGIVLVSCTWEQFLLHKAIAPEHGFPAFYKKPLIWIKTGAGVPYQAKWFPTSGYEILFFTKRQKDVQIFKQGTPDWINFTQLDSDRIHPTQKPVGFYEVLLERYAFPDYKLVDPFCGSGSTIIAAAKRLLPLATGVELNPETAKLSQERLLSVLSKIQSGLST